MEKFTIDHDIKVLLNDEWYLLEKGDVIMTEKKINGREVEYPCTDKEHTQSAIGYIMKYQNDAGEVGAKAKRNKVKVTRAAKKFGIELPENW